MGGKCFKCVYSVSELVAHLLCVHTPSHGLKASLAGWPCGLVTSVPGLCPLQPGMQGHVQPAGPLA